MLTKIKKERKKRHVERRREGHVEKGKGKGGKTERERKLQGELLRGRQGEVEEKRRETKRRSKGRSSSSHLFPITLQDTES